MATCELFYNDFSTNTSLLRTTAFSSETGAGIATATTNHASMLGADDENAIAFAAADITTPASMASAIGNLTNTPSDFTSATSITADYRVRVINWTNDTIQLFVRVFAADGTTPLTDEVGFSAHTANASESGDSISLTGVVAGDKSTWDGAKLQLRADHTSNMGADSGHMLVDFVRLTITYTSAWTGTQVSYRWFADDAAIASSTALANQDAGWAPLLTANAQVQLRVRLDETSGASATSTDDWQLQYQVNGGAWNDVTPSSTRVRGYEASTWVTHGAAVASERLTGGTGTFVSGECADTGTVVDYGLGSGNVTEFVYALEFVFADFTQADVVNFRVLRNGATTGLTYSQTPTATVTIPGSPNRPLRRRRLALTYR